LLIKKKFVILGPKLNLQTFFMPTPINPRKSRPFVYYKGPEIFWFRIFGYGLSIRSYKHGFIPFSIRNGYKKVMCIFDHYIEFLKPDKH